jgi:hypothetical protein
LYDLDEDLKGYRVEADTLGGTQSIAAVNELGAHMLLAKSRKPEAKAYLRKILEFFLAAKAHASEQHKELPRSELLMKEYEFVLKHLPTLTDTTKLRLLKLAAPNIAGTLVYTETGATGQRQHKAATHLLRDHGIAIGTVKFLGLCVSHGILVRNTRTKKDGKQTSWVSFTETGQKFGHDERHEKSPLETQALFYSDTFSELLALLDLKE